MCTHIYIHARTGTRTHRCIACPGTHACTCTRVCTHAPTPTGADTGCEAAGAAAPSPPRGQPGPPPRGAGRPARPLSPPRSPAAAPAASPAAARPRSLRAAPGTHRQRRPPAPPCRAERPPPPRFPPARGSRSRGPQDEQPPGSARAAPRRPRRPPAAPAAGHGAALHPQEHRDQQHHVRLLPHLLGRGQERPGARHPLLHRPQQEGEQELQQVQAPGRAHQAGGQGGAAAHDRAGPLVPEPAHRVQRGRADGREAERRRVPRVRLERDGRVLHGRLRQGASAAAAGEGRGHRRAHAALLRLLPQPAQGVFPARQGALRQRDEALAEGQQRQPRLAHERHAARHLLQLQHRVQHRAAAAGLALRPLPLPDPGAAPLQPRHQPLLRGLLLHVHRLPLRGPGPGAQGLGGRPLLPRAPAAAGHCVQQVPDVLRRGGRPRVPPRAGQHPRGHLHRARGPRPRRARRDQRPPAHEPLHGQRQEGPQLQDVQHQRGPLGAEARGPARAQSGGAHVAARSRGDARGGDAAPAALRGPGQRLVPALAPAAPASSLSRSRARRLPALPCAELRSGKNAIRSQNGARRPPRCRPIPTEDSRGVAEAPAATKLPGESTRDATRCPLRHHRALRARGPGRTGCPDLDPQDVPEGTSWPQRCTGRGTSPAWSAAPHARAGLQHGPPHAVPLHPAPSPSPPALLPCDNKPCAVTAGVSRCSLSCVPVPRGGDTSSGWMVTSKRPKGELLSGDPCHSQASLIPLGIAGGCAGNGGHHRGLQDRAGTEQLRSGGARFPGRPRPAHGPRRCRRQPGEGARPHRHRRGSWHSSSGRGRLGAPGRPAHSRRARWDTQGTQRGGARHGYALMAFCSEFSRESSQPCRLRHQPRSWAQSSACRPPFCSTPGPFRPPGAFGTCPSVTGAAGPAPAPARHSVSGTSSSSVTGTVGGQAGCRGAFFVLLLLPPRALGRLVLPRGRRGAARFPGRLALQARAGALRCPGTAAGRRRRCRLLQPGAGERGRGPGAARWQRGPVCSAQRAMESARPSPPRAACRGPAPIAPRPARPRRPATSSPATSL